MKHTIPPVLLYQVVVIFTLVANTIFVATYTRLEPWWRNPIGFTIAIESFLLSLALTPTVLSLFFSFSRFTSESAEWFDLGIIFLIGAVMIWRTIVFTQTSREERTRLRERTAANEKRFREGQDKG